MNLKKFQRLEYITVLDVPTRKKGDHKVPAHFKEFVGTENYKNIELNVA